MTVAGELILGRSFEAPDETRTYYKLVVELVSLGEMIVSRHVYEPGWRWSDSIWPLVRPEGCQDRHAFYMVSGHMKVHMNDGAELEFGPGEVGVIPAGHDAWVVGTDPVELIDFGGNIPGGPNKWNVAPFG
jgi:hypothetical protein